MPTGYTSDIRKGISFKQFALQCARNFGACVSLRDESMDAPIPEEFKPDTEYHDKSIAEAESKIKGIEGMSEEEVTIRVRTEFEAAIDGAREHIRESNELRQKYQDMIDQVEAWTPPTKDHVNMKDFMLEQLQASIEFDCNVSYWEKDLREVKMVDNKTWRAVNLQRALDEITYHVKERKEEIERAASRTKWIRALKESLK